MAMGVIRQKIEFVARGWRQRPGTAPVYNVLPCCSNKATAAAHARTLNSAARQLGVAMPRLPWLHDGSMAKTMLHQFTSEVSLEPEIAATIRPPPLQGRR
jgi:hypothetical protein